MRAALARQLSGIDSVELGELPDPAPAAGQALIRVHGAGVGPWDAGFLGGGFPGLALPFVPGQEVAGVVEAVGDGAGVQPGERVYAVPGRVCWIGWGPPLRRAVGACGQPTTCPLGLITSRLLRRPFGSRTRRGRRRSRVDLRG
jgi:NADPH:quinone reductase-like Zn-dependent oxidoreductase